jgi:hypothetical protein
MFVGVSVPRGNREALHLDTCLLQFLHGVFRLLASATTEVVEVIIISMLVGYLGVDYALFKHARYVPQTSCQS